MTKGLLVVANPHAGSDIVRSIEGTGWDYEISELGADALSAAIQLSPAVIVIDAREITYSHTLFCQTLRELIQPDRTQVIAVTAPDSSQSCSILLNTGADDCWTEPVKSQQFQLRLKRIHQRLFPPRPLLKRGAIEVDPDCHKVRVNGRAVHLPEAQRRLLQHFLENPGKSFSESELLGKIWANAKTRESTLSTCIERLCRQISRAGQPLIIREATIQRESLSGRYWTLSHPSDSSQGS